MLLCSNVATARSGDEQLAAAQLRQLGDVAERFGVRVAYEALAWGRFVDSYEAAARIVRLADHPRIGLCLDSFHILSKGHSPEAIETIPADKIFFVQMADAPLLSIDVLSWSRHHRLFPGEGGFDLGTFMAHLVRTGYDGPVSLEIFNDTFRQSDPVATAIDARRSLRWLEHETARALGSTGPAAAPRGCRRPASRGRAACRRQLRRACAPASCRPQAAAHATRLPLPRPAPDQERRAVVAGCGSHRARRTRLASVASRRSRASASRSTIPPPALRRPRISSRPRCRAEEGAGEETLVGVRAPDGSEVFFGAGGGTGAGMGEGVRRTRRARRDPHLIERVDHVNLAQPWQHFDAAVLFFRSVLDLRAEASIEVAAPVGLVRSQVLRSADGVLRIALNLVPSGAADDAILPQHIAFATSDVLALARAARERGFRPLDIPRTTTTTSRRATRSNPPSWMSSGN